MNCETPPEEQITYYYGLFQSELQKCQKLQEKVDQLTAANEILKEVKESYVTQVADLEKQVTRLDTDCREQTREIIRLREAAQDRALLNEDTVMENEVLWRKVTKLNRDLEETKF